MAKGEESKGSNVMRSIHGVGELMTQVVLRGGGFLPMAPMAAAPEGNVKQSEPEKEDILVMDTKLKIIEILQVPGTQEILNHLILWCGGMGAVFI
ncbi:PREDICTED: inositol 1,4,5-trisphosphate receptor type 1-like [Crocodylus porosus]|uniref:inositol 1,4,5-trisphosphate receptor type 1-like n=1 Tax=Crocodylus porosus TaxID=8502 RepID=UPI00093E010D|nr:PREDICTED: inositol 1,4,5-trisphosphate receptor type 1-like [Crocodylus porosus]